MIRKKIIELIIGVIIIIRDVWWINKEFSYKIRSKIFLEEVITPEPDSLGIGVRVASNHTHNQNNKASAVCAYDL